MLTDEVLHFRGEIILTRDLLPPAERAEFYARVRHEEFSRVFRGVYVRADLWRSLGRDARYRLRIEAASLIEPESVFAFESAAAVWRLPMVGPWPSRVHVICSRTSTSNSTSMFVRHLVGVPQEIDVVGGLRVTSLARTVIDVAATASFGTGVTMADAALRRVIQPAAGVPHATVFRSDLLRELAGVDLRHGSARARRVVEFADGSADRPGESLSRVAMHIAHVSPPLLQVTRYGASGAKYIVDFWWPEFGMIGEFDGRAKYTDPDFLRGRTPEQALADEKDREDDLRAAGDGMTRWSWEIALSPARLKAHLARAGVR